MKKVRCADCGVWIERHEQARREKMYCPDCQKRRKREAVRSWREKKREEDLDIPIKKNLRLDEIQREAHEAGMSYGRYVAMKKARRVDSTTGKGESKLSP